MKSVEMRPMRAFATAVFWWTCSIALFVLVHWLTVPFERKAVSSVVDTALEASGDARRVETALGTSGSDGKASLAGLRFSLKGTKERVVVFSVNGAGTVCSFVAVYDPDQGVRAVLPLDPDSRRYADRLPAGLLETHVRRIAASETFADMRKDEK